MRRSICIFLLAALFFLLALTACSAAPAPTSSPLPGSTQIPVESTQTDESAQTPQPVQTREPTDAPTDDDSAPTAAYPDPLNNLLQMRSVKISLNGSRPDGRNRSIAAEIDETGNMRLRYSQPAIKTEALSEGTDVSWVDSFYEIYVIDGNAYAPSESDPTWMDTPVAEDYVTVLSDQMHGLEGFTTWLDMLPRGSLQPAEGETVGGFSADKYAVDGVIGGRQINGALWYDPSTHALVKAELRIPAVLDSDPANPESGDIVITLNAEKSVVEPINLPPK